MNIHVRGFIIIHSASLFMLAMMAVSLFTGCKKEDDSLRGAISHQLLLYPESTLLDLYKTFFQDEYGPGHMLEDTAGAGNYLESELAAMTSRGRRTIEPCGQGKNFFRAPLDLVKDDVVPKEFFFRAFTASAQRFRMPDHEEWKAKWATILSEIEDMNLELDHFQSDRASITEMLARGEVVVHHSPAYLQCYDPHYRIMSREQAVLILTRIRQNR